MKRLKILCLHGHSSSRAVLKELLQVWPSNILEMMDLLVFIDAPFPRHDLPIPGFSWFEDSAEDVTMSDRTFNESVAYIEETMVKLVPFDGVLGFSQLLYRGCRCRHLMHGKVWLTKVEAIKFVVVISGGKLGGIKFRAPKLAENAFSSPIEIPSLHCFGQNDRAKIELLKSFVDPFVIFHSGGHEVPKLDEEGLKVMLSFLSKIQPLLPSSN